MMKSITIIRTKVIQTLSKRKNSKLSQKFEI